MALTIDIPNMDLFNREELKTLAQTEADVHVSLYMPTIRVEADLDQNHIRLKNLLKQSRQKLKDAGKREEDIDSLLSDVQSRVDDKAFWINQSDGLAIFVTPEFTRFWRLPLDFEELALVGDRFHLKPLFPLIATNNRFYVLALSQNRVRLFLGTHYSMNEIVSNEIPRSITDALFFDDPERQLQFHTGNRAGNRRDNVFHGQGRQNDDVRSRPQDQLRRFFREVDHGLAQTLQDDTAPLLLAGVEYYLPLYRDANSYQHMIEDEIVGGNPEHLNLKDLHSKAWEVIEKHFLESQKASIEQFRETSGQDEEMASTRIDEIVPAAAFSRIDTLYVPIGAHRWGRFNADANEVEVHEEYENGDEDLLDFAAVNTYLNGGNVHALRRENMPVEAELAATFRFPVKETA